MFNKLLTVPSFIHIENHAQYSVHKNRQTENRYGAVEIRRGRFINVHNRNSVKAESMSSPTRFSRFDPSAGRYFLRKTRQQLYRFRNFLPSAEAPPPAA